MLSLAWVEHQIEEAINGENTPNNVRDFALLCIAREYLKAAQTPTEAQSKAPSTRVVLTDYSADLNKIPKVEEIDAAIMSAAKTTYTPEGREQLRDMKTWADILKYHS